MIWGQGKLITGGLRRGGPVCREAPVAEELFWDSPYTPSWMDGWEGRWHLEMGRLGRADRPFVQMPAAARGTITRGGDATIILVHRGVGEKSFGIGHAL